MDDEEPPLLTSSSGGIMSAPPSSAIAEATATTAPTSPVPPVFQRSNSGKNLKSPVQTTAPAPITTTTSMNTASTTAATATTSSTNLLIPKQRLYRATGGADGNSTKWVTREIAALDFLLGIPLQAEASIVQQGWLLQQEQLREKNKDNSIDNANNNSASGDSYYYDGAAAAATATTKGRWWEKWIQQEDIQEANNKAAAAASHRRGDLLDINNRQGAVVGYETELERPSAAPSAAATAATTMTTQTQTQPAFYAPPGRRLEGDEAVRVQIPLTTRTLTKQRYIARQAALRQWELQTAHGITTTMTTVNKKINNTASASSNTAPSTPTSTAANTTASSIASTTTPSTATNVTTTTTGTTTTTTTKVIPPLLDGRLFFSAGGSYPVSVFSVIRYEPRKEELLRRRQKLEALGGGGSQFVMPTRDWRGISYRSLLPRRDTNLDNKKLHHHHHHHRHHHHPSKSHGHHHHHHHHHRRRPRRPKNFNRFLRNQQDEQEDGNNGDNDAALLLDDTNDGGGSASHQSKSSNKGGTGDDDSSSTGSESSSLSDDDDENDLVYVPGVLDDPQMVLGRHRTVMIGDRVTGPLVSSTIQFVKPALLKAELNKMFRERFDGWEPPRAARKYIGARVVDGQYKLMDPKEGQSEEDYTTTTTAAAAASATTTNNSLDDNRSWHRQGSSVSSAASETGTGGGNTTAAASSSVPTLSKEKQIRMPPSLTLSKIRSLKRQALAACVKAKLEIGTVALACVYFERLCLDCRVDKSNRRLSFAACLLLAAKLNEPNVGLVMRNTDGGGGGGGTTSTSNNNNNSSNDGMSNRLQSLIRPNRRSRNMFASLLEFFAEDWNLALPVLFSAEWAVFAALGFSLHAKPSQVAFHFKRLMKTLEWNPRRYLGPTMFHQWQDALDAEEERNQRREKRKEKKRRQKEEQLLNLHIELVSSSRKTGEHDNANDEPTPQGPRPPEPATSTVASSTTGSNTAANKQEKSSARIMDSGMRLLNRFGMRRIMSRDKMDLHQQHPSGTAGPQPTMMSTALNSASDHPTSSTRAELSTTAAVARRRSHQQGTSVLPISSSMPLFPSHTGVGTSATRTDVAATSNQDGVDGTGIVAIDIPATEEGSEASSSIGSIADSEKGIIL